MRELEEGVLERAALGDELVHLEPVVEREAGDLCGLEVRHVESRVAGAFHGRAGVREHPSEASRFGASDANDGCCAAQELLGRYVGDEPAPADDDDDKEQT